MLVLESPQVRFIVLIPKQTVLIVTQRATHLVLQRVHKKAQNVIMVKYVTMGDVLSIIVLKSKHCVM
jgi:hypothetical protein